MLKKLEYEFKYRICVKFIIEIIKLNHVEARTNILTNVSFIQNQASSSSTELKILKLPDSGYIS